MNETIVSRQALSRMPAYLQYLHMIDKLGRAFVTATEVAEALRLNPIQVRKDIAAVSKKPGKPMVGFCVKELIRDFNEFLAYENVKDAVLVGTGALGSALLNYSGFSGCGIRLAAVFDKDPEKIGKRIGGHTVSDAGELAGFCRKSGILIGIVAVPDYVAQGVCDQLVAGGVRAIWNFAPAHLSVPGDVILQNENLVASLTVLSKRLAERLEQKQ